MNFGLIVLIALFVAFILLLLFNPNLTCFGRRLRSPFYPLRRRRLLAAKGKSQLKPEDYGFRLSEDETKASPRGTEAQETKAVPSSGEERKPAHGHPLTPQKKPQKTEDYGFKLD